MIYHAHVHKSFLSTYKIYHFFFLYSIHEKMTITYNKTATVHVGLIQYHYEIMKCTAFFSVKKEFNFFFQILVHVLLYLNMRQNHVCKQTYSYHNSNTPLENFVYGGAQVENKIHLNLNFA